MHQGAVWSLTHESLEDSLKHGCKFAWSRRRVSRVEALGTYVWVEDEREDKHLAITFQPVPSLF